MLRFSVTLPQTVLKSLSTTSTSRQPPISFKSYMSAKPSATIEGSKSGPQRVVPKPTLLHSNSDSIAKKAAIMKSDSNLSKPANISRLARPTPFMAKSALNLTKSPEKTPHGRLPTSSSTGDLLKTTTTARIPTLSQPMSSENLQIASSSIQPTLEAQPCLIKKDASLSSSMSWSSVFLPNQSARSKVIEFREALGRVDAGWDKRQQAILEFTKILDSSEMQQYLTKSEKNVEGICKLFQLSIGDIHAQVVLAVLEMGRTLLSFIPIEKHSKPVQFASQAIFSLYKAATDITFKAKPVLIEGCHAMIDELARWLNNLTRFVEAMILAFQMPAKFDKPRIAVAHRLSVLLNSSDLIFDHEIIKCIPSLYYFHLLVFLDFTRKSSHLLIEADPALVSALSDLIVAIGLHVPAQDLVQHIPDVIKPFWEKKLIKAEPNVQIDSPTLNLITLNPPTVENGSKHEDEMPQVEEKSSSEPKKLLSVSQSQEIVLDAELGITMRIKSKTAPSTPRSAKQPAVVDFDTPRSMDHDPEGPETESESDDGIIEQYVNDPQEEEESMIPEPTIVAVVEMVPIEQLEIQY